MKSFVAPQSLLFYFILRLSFVLISIQVTIADQPPPTYEFQSNGAICSESFGSPPVNDCKVALSSRKPDETNQWFKPGLENKKGDLPFRFAEGEFEQKLPPSHQRTR